MDNLLDRSFTNEKYAFQKTFLEGKIPRAQWVESEVHGLTVMNAEIENLAIAASTVTASRFVGARFLRGEVLGAAFQHCVFHDVVFEDVVFREVEFSHCAFSQCTWKESTSEGLACEFVITRGLFLSPGAEEALACHKSVVLKDCLFYQPKAFEAPKKKIPAAVSSTSEPIPRSAAPKTAPSKEETRFAGLEI